MSQLTTRYETVQNYNVITRFIHHGRYLKLLRVLEGLRHEIGNRRIRILDIGCGPGSAVSHIVRRFDVEYVGLDYDPTFIDAARLKYRHLDNCRFVVGDATDDDIYRQFDADVVIALETLEHIPLNGAARVIELVCRTVRPHVFLVTVPVEIGPAVWIKNWGSALMGYDRKSGNFRETFWAGVYQLDRIPPHDVSHRGFDWRCLAQLIRVNAPLREVRGLPFSFLPRLFSPNVCLVAEPRKNPAPLPQERKTAWKINHEMTTVLSTVSLLL